MILMDILNEIGATPGLPAWEFGVKCYAVELLKNYMDDNRYNIYDDVSVLSRLTEVDLLNGTKDWEQYSRDGNALVNCEDICKRLGDRAPDKDDCEACLHGYEDILNMQAKALKEAADLVLNTIKKGAG